LFQKHYAVNSLVSRFPCGAESCCFLFRNW